MRSPVYVDNRTIPFWPDVWRLAISGFEQLIIDHSIPFDVLAGIETAGIPHSAALAYALRKPSVFVRKEPKDHGEKKRVEGGNVADKQVLLIEDHITTGGSSLGGVEALRAEGAHVDHCLAITTYGFREASKSFANARVNLHVLCSFATLAEEGEHMRRFGTDELAVIHDWAADPHGWAARQGLNS
jgi:orotate phosphoribosyltransferase